MTSHETTKEGIDRLVIHTSLDPDDVAYLRHGITAVLHDLMTGDRTQRGRDGAAYLLVLLGDMLPGEKEEAQLRELAGL